MGSNRFPPDAPRCADFYLQGRLKPDELVTQRLRLGQVNKEFVDMEESVELSVIVF